MAWELFRVQKGIHELLGKSMTKAKQAAKPVITRFSDLGTPERRAKDQMEVGGENRGMLVIKVKDALRIDKLLRRKMIDELQHFYGLQIIVMHTIVNRSRIASGLYHEELRIPGSQDNAMVNDLTVRDKYNFTISHLSPQNYGIITLICFDELSATDTCSKLGIDADRASDIIPRAFDGLGEALVAMREHFDDEANARFGT